VGFFDFLKRDKGPGTAPEEEAYADRKLGSLAKKATNKRLQPFDRDEALRAVLAIGTHEAAVSLLKRFSFQIDPSITDQDEKQMVFDGIVAIGLGERGKRVSDAGKDPKEISSKKLTEEEIRELRDAIIDKTREYCKKAENLTWPLKVMRALLNDKAYQRELLQLLADWDTEYTRNVEPKINLLAGLEDVKSEKIRAAVAEYLGDVNETVRFHAVQTTFAQGDPATLPALVKMMKSEESMRVKNKVCDGIAAKDWVIPEAERDTFREAMSGVYEWAFDAKTGKVKKAR
jgi:hypothetical protein